MSGLVLLMFLPLLGNFHPSIWDTAKYKLKKYISKQKKKMIIKTFFAVLNLRLCNISMLKAKLQCLLSSPAAVAGNNSSDTSDLSCQPISWSYYQLYLTSSTDHELNAQRSSRHGSVNYHWSTDNHLKSIFKKRIVSFFPYLTFSNMKTFFALCCLLRITL